MLNTPSRQDPALLSSMDPAQIARAVQHCPIPLDSALQVGTFCHEMVDPIQTIWRVEICAIIPPLRHHISNLFLSLDSDSIASR